MSDELVSAAMTVSGMNRLHQSIKEFNEQSSKQTEQMLRFTHQLLWLTRVMAWLTLIMTIGVGVQIYLAIK